MTRDYLAAEPENDKAAGRGEMARNAAAPPEGPAAHGRVNVEADLRPQVVAPSVVWP